MHKVLFAACCFALSSTAFAQDSTPITLEQAMADPDWIGRPIESAWWAWDSKTVHFTQQRTESTIRDQYQVGENGEASKQLDGKARAAIDSNDQAVDRAGRKMAFVRNGDVFVRDLTTGRLTQVTRSVDRESGIQWSTNGNLIYRNGQQWYVWQEGQGVTTVAPVKVGKDPLAEPKLNDLQKQQLEVFSTLKSDVEKREARRKQELEWSKDDPTVAPPSAYIDANAEIDATSLSPNGQWMLVVTHDKSADKGRESEMPKWITESGYWEKEDVRTLVGRNNPLNQDVWLVDVRAGKASKLDLSGLPGINVDPLAAMRAKSGMDALKGPRPVRIETDGDGLGTSVRWRDDGNEVAMMVRAVDNKDRWIATVTPSSSLKPISRHRLTDNAWINWNFNEFGFTPDNALWYLSEESGFSHLYVQKSGAARALTSGKWEVSSPVLNRQGTQFYFVCNRANPGTYEVCNVPAGGGNVRELTSLKGVENLVLSPDQSKLLVTYSGSYLPKQLATVSVNGGAATVLTDTRTPEFKARKWIEPQYVQIPSKHGAGTIWGKYYGPSVVEPGRKYPIVFFVHGAGYLQNVSQRYPNYFREQMFHNMLVQKGYIVMDIDYRASEGYGRDWRTAIYRGMGHPELEDHLDALDWMVANKQGDADRAGIYGGSYGGFMTFMALMRAPGKFKAGAALRPVVDWTQYNHEYTSNILNTPQLDPEAYRKSSPIFYAQNLQDRLLILHGMIDDNVFYRDSVMMAQKLIELRKTRWELASYPMERHGFVNSDSWYDEYRRIWEMFEDELK